MNVVAILDSMFARRIVPLVLALTVAFAPVALEACQAACALHAMAAAGGDEHHHHGAIARDMVPAQPTPSGHSCHDATPVTVADADQATMSARPHSCSHSDELPVTATALALVTLQAPALKTIVFELTPRVDQVSLFALTPAAGDSIPIASNLPLRI